MTILLFIYFETFFSCVKSTRIRYLYRLFFLYISKALGAAELHCSIVPQMMERVLQGTKDFGCAITP